MEMAVIPYIENPDIRLRTIDELPQSGKGKMIMTVEPKFIPNQAVSIDLQEDLKINVRLVDCVGYVIEGASGYQDDSGIRLVKTPWYNESIPFDQAAKIGTKKVIQDHSTIGIVMTSDGSFLDIEERNYHQATQDIIEELQNKYKNLQITAMVRGGIASNDATMEDAEEIGLTNVVPVIGNGVAIMGTVKEQLSEEAKEKIQNADIIIAKGMGNFESMYQEGMNPYYLLLCKCELYKEIFGVEMFQPIFCKEERL